MTKKPNLAVRILICCALSAAVVSCANEPPKTTTPRATTTSKPTTHNYVRWEKSIAALEARDAANPPPRNAILFTGSSSIVRWKTLAQDFPKYPVINHGFGGSEIVDATHFADRIIFPFHPRMVVLRAGSNDIHAGKSPQEVFGDYQDFVATIRRKLPETPIVFVGQSPAPIRFEEREKVKTLNKLVEQYSRATPGLVYIETYDLTITPDDKPREDLFVADRLHPNAEGYKLMAERVRPYLEK